MSAQPPVAPLPPPPLLRPIGPPGGVVAPIGGVAPPLVRFPAPPLTGAPGAVPDPEPYAGPIASTPIVDAPPETGKPPPPPPPPPGTPARTPSPLIDTREEPRDLLQRIGDALWPRVKRLGGRAGGAGWILVVLLFGVTAPIALLRTGIDARVRLLAASAIFLTWLALITGG